MSHRVWRGCFLLRIWISYSYSIDLARADYQICLLLSKPGRRDIVHWEPRVASTPSRTLPRLIH
jgi:hypothetical protein